MNASFTILITCVLLAGNAAWAAPTSAQSRRTEHTLKLDDPANRPAATIDQMAWLAGTWEGELFGGRFEEHWSAPSVGTMPGIFKLIHDGVVTFYEFAVFVEEEGSLALKLKHFNADMTGWEEKDDFVTFPLVEITDEAALFSGLSYRRQGPDRVLVHLALRRQGELIEEEMTFRRVKDSR